MSLTKLSPVIISVSRRTDIPAFFSESFIHDLELGYTVWTNPYNRTQKQIISFEKTKVMIFWTKNPAPFFPYLSKLNKKNIHYYFLYTLNDYEKEQFEPNLPDLKIRIQTFQTLSRLIGKEKVLWRFDPLILTSSLSYEALYKRIFSLYEQLKNYTEKLIISFVDLHYRKVSQMKKQFFVLDWTDDLKEKMAEQLSQLDLNIATCAETLDLSKYGIEHNKCIDDSLMKRIFGQDKDLMEYLKNIKKDKNQRPACGCIESKDIGQYYTCRYHCVYCYAN